MYPCYRKYKNGTSWFRINGPDDFEEVKIIGGKYFRFRFEAKILPDRNFVSDLIHHYHEYWDICTEEEFLKAYGMSAPSRT
ncbi:MAG: hypothetical protein IT233_11695 [Bacteroidia bacterium]|nr:hypothetical protein [Bacteroidia bacterium]